MSITARTSKSLSDEDFLGRLGGKVRQTRAQRGMSRRALAELADVSERYLAQLEAGKGNVSILLLRQIARAMGLRLESLTDLIDDRPIGYEFLREHLQCCDEEEIRRIQQFVSGQDNHLQAQKYSRDQRIAFIGLRGAGKSTVGRKIAEQLDLPFKELTHTIEQIAGMNLTEIFSLGGQSSYRHFEKKAIANLLKEHEHGIFAIGGSVVSETATFENLLASCTTIWLRASPEAHMDRVIGQGDYRPMAGNRHAMDELKRILIEREDAYRRADYIIDTQDKTVSQTLDDVLNLPPIKSLP